MSKLERSGAGANQQNTPRLRRRTAKALAISAACVITAMAACCAHRALAPALEGRRVAPQMAPSRAEEPPAPLTIDLDIGAATAEEIKDVLTEAAQKDRLHDPAGCVEILDRVARQSPRMTRTAAYWLMHSGCLMQADRCDQGMAEYRAYIKALGIPKVIDKHQFTDQEVDEMVRDAANRACSSATAKTDFDYVVRAGRELARIAPTAELNTCRTRADALAARAAKLNDSEDDHGRAYSLGLNRAMDCAARTGTCKDALAIYKQIVHLSSRHRTNIDAEASEKFADQVRDGYIHCK